LSLAALRRYNRRFPPPPKPPEGHVWNILIIEDATTGKTLRYEGWMRQEYLQAVAIVKMGETPPYNILKIAHDEVKRVMAELGYAGASVVSAKPYKPEPNQYR